MYRKDTLAKFSLVLLAALLATASCLASEGVIEISQAIVEDEGGFPFTIAGAGSYRLTTNLDAGATTAIEITAGTVTVDLNGFHIVGGGPQAAGSLEKGMEFGYNGVYGAPATSVTVLNGSVRGFDAGVFLEGSGNAVKMVTASNNFVGIYIHPSEGKGLSDAPGFAVAGGLVENCKAVENAFGIAGIGIVLSDSVVSGNFAAGMPECQDCTITNNLVADSGSVGIVCSRCTISGNKVTGSLLKGPPSLDATGIQAEDSLITGNTILVSTGLGMERRWLLPTVPARRSARTKVSR